MDAPDGWVQTRRGRGNVIMPEIAYSLNYDDMEAIMSRQPGK
jgi:hypothetical protein